MSFNTSTLGVYNGEREEEKRGQVIFEFHDPIIVSHVPPLLPSTAFSCLLKPFGTIGLLRDQWRKVVRS